MRLIATLVLVFPLACHSAIDCGPFVFDHSAQAVRVNGDPLTVTRVTFSGAAGDYDNVTLELNRSRITDRGERFYLTSSGGRISMEYKTNEIPPRTLNRNSCNGNLGELRGLK